jgi:DNA polymerase/3'-5' exonuclease PolX
MSTGERRPLAEARENAEKFRTLLAWAAARWEIAGSIRRGCETVGDVEHVVIPEFVNPPRDRSGLFGVESAPKVNAVWQVLDELIVSRAASKAVYPDGKHRWGDKYRGVMFEGVRHEIFVADHLNWGAILAIRTGPAEFSKMLVTKLAAAGRYRQQDGYVRYVSGLNNAVRAVPEESDFFTLCGVALVQPEERRDPPLVHW